MTQTPDPDPTRESRWRPLHALLRDMYDEIAQLYAERSLADIRPRFVGPLITLGRQGPATIRQLADAFEVTHSAMSQTVGSLRRDGYVRNVPGGDKRVRTVELTEHGEELLPFLRAEWHATEQAIAELEEEVAYPMSQVVRDIEAALARRPFRDRLEAALNT